MGRGGSVGPGVVSSEASRPVFAARTAWRPRCVALVVGLFGLILVAYVATLVVAAWTGPDGAAPHLPAIERFDRSPRPIGAAAPLLDASAPSPLPFLSACGAVIGVLIWIGLDRRRSATRLADRSRVGERAAVDEITKPTRRKRGASRSTVCGPRVGRWWPALAVVVVSAIVFGLVASYYTAGTMARDRHVDDGFPALAVGTGPVLELGRAGVRSVHVPEKRVALTFDDGPDPLWTPAILDVLAEQRVPGTFFVVGEHVVEHPEIVRRILRQGGELGVHTYRHLEITTQPRADLHRDLGLTQLAIIGATGRATGLFRPPFITDPSTVDLHQYVALEGVSARGYVTVLANRDSSDWSRPGVNEIVLRSMPTGDAGAIIELHDGGGDRSQTIAALGTLIRLLKERGYQFDTVSGIAGLRADRVMPAAGGFEHIWARSFLAIAGSADTLSFWFVAIALGVALVTMIRLAFVIIGALRSRRSWSVSLSTAEPLPPMSVIVAAYNEAESLPATLRALSAARVGELQIVVVDDGSTDDTAGIAASHPDARVEVVTIPHAGKAVALTAGLAHCTADVIVTVDADTRVAPDALAALVAPFADETVGGVSGNLRVAEPRGLLGAAQHLEYIMGNALDRAALDSIGTQVTIPGAAGAFRRSALEAVGGFDAATVAEDTDLTLALVHAGWKVRFVRDARAETTAPTTIRGLWRQRSRWSFGIVQAVWRRRTMVRTIRSDPRATFTWLAVLVSQIILPIAAPFIDLAAIWALTTGADFPLALWLAVAVLHLGAAVVALRHEGQSLSWLRALPLHLFGYRQVTAFVVLQALAWAVAGRRPGWGVRISSATVQAPPSTRSDPAHPGAADDDRAGDTRRTSRAA